MGQRARDYPATCTRHEIRQPEPRVQRRPPGGCAAARAPVYYNDGRGNPEQIRTSRRRPPRSTSRPELSTLRAAAFGRDPRDSRLHLYRRTLMQIPALGIAVAAASFALIPVAARQHAEYAAHMNASAETPPNLSHASGTVTLSITGTELHYMITVGGLSGSATAAHIHDDANGVAEPLSPPT